MDSNLVNYLLAFIEGFALIVSPCILPVLPIMLSGSIEGGRARPWGIITGFVLTFAFFTFFSRALVHYYGLDLDLVRKVAFIAIACFGVILVSDKLSEKFSLATQGIANLGSRFTQNNLEGGFGSGILLGSLVSLIWVPCGGPILAAAIVQTATQNNSWHSFLTFLFFALGSVIPMVILSLIGKKVLDRFSFLKTQTGRLRKIFGIIIISGAIFAAFYVPGSNFSATPLAPNILLPTTLEKSNNLIDPISTPYPAPSIESNGAWINSTPLNLDNLKGKVILVDFWTYSCINCVRTLPYTKVWYDKYKDKGFVIIGVHAPEFEFEKNLSNVKMAVAKYGITYPVVLDNDYVIWSNYNNRYWPAQYLINKQGEVVYTHFGEGNDAETEHNIQVLLGLSGKKSITTEETQSAYSSNQSPETYLGYARGNLLNSIDALTHDSNYHYPNTLAPNEWALQGHWKINGQEILSLGNDSAIKINFNAAKVYIVAGSRNGKTIPIKVILNGQTISMKEAGMDVKNGVLNLESNTLYQIVNLNKSQQGILELQVNSPGAELYTFTFGG